jgi:hypothetical protein
VPAADDPNSNRAQARGTVALDPAYQGAATIAQYADVGAELIPLFDALRSQGEAVQAGDLGMCERMLVAQAQTLNVLFGELARRAAKTKLLPHAEVYLRLALRAQNQSRTTIETLGLLKNPVGPTFIRQANVAASQQVNNLAVARGPATSDAPSKIIEHGTERLDA